MSYCQRCQSNRIANVSAKCSDCCGYSVGDSNDDGYVPDDMGVGGRDYMEITYCLHCGQLQGEFPLPPSKIEKDITDEEVLDFFDNYFYTGSAVTSILSSNKYKYISCAKDLSYKFGRFMENFIETNSGIYSAAKFPSSKVFLTMYRTNKWDL